MRYALLILLFLCSALFSSGQNSTAVKRMEKQRKDTQADIELTDKLLRETTRTAQNSFNRLNLLSQQLLNRKKVVDILNEEISSLDVTLAEINKELSILEDSYTEKKNNYTKSVQGLYKRRSSMDKLLFVLSADNFTQSMRRMRYLREYADWQKRQAVQINTQQKEISEKKDILEETKTEKEALLISKAEEQKKLEGEEVEQKKEVDELNKKKKALQTELNKKKQQATALDKKIEAQIAKEIALALAAEQKAERERKAREQKNSNAPVKEEPRVAASKGGYAMTQTERKLSSDFAENRGRLPSPLNARYTIVSFFGEQQHKVLKQVRMNNNGIDLQTTQSADAVAVFDGVVTSIFVVPGYNNSVIIRHGNYLTVYSNLSQVYVKQGDKVSTRQAIGKVFTDTGEGGSTILHFQLWKEKTKLNPAAWISR
jgi:Membrane-bound metallopeptidase